MIHEAIATGESTSEAIENAKAKLNAPKDAEVHTEIIEMPKKKVLGIFGGTPAKARAYYEQPEQQPEKKQPKAAGEGVKKQAAPAAPAAAPAPQKKASEPEKAKEQAAPVDAAEPAPEMKSVDISKDPALSAAAAYLTSVLELMGVGDVECSAYNPEPGEVVLELNCSEDYGVIIGRRGETLDALQYLSRLVANRNSLGSESDRIRINVGNYREKRKLALKQLAEKNAAKVLKYGRSLALEPMNPYERRIIHTTVQLIDGVTSYSVGSDSARKVVIALEPGVKPTHPSKGGYNNRRGHSRQGQKGSSRPPRRDAQRPSAPTRAPKTDAGAKGTSLYGKLN